MVFALSVSDIRKNKIIVILVPYLHLSCYNVYFDLSRIDAIIAWILNLKKKQI